MNTQPEIMHDDNSTDMQAYNNNPAPAIQQPQDEGSQMMAMIANAANNPDVDVGKLERLMAMHKEFKADKAKEAYITAMTSAQSEMQRVLTRHKNKETGSLHAKLDDIDTVGRPVYTKHGFSLSFSSQETPEGFITMTCTVGHKDGHEKQMTKSGWRDDVGPKGGATKTKIQGSSSTGTYLRRYLTCEAFNIVTTEMVQSDNDGNSPPKYISDIQRGIILEKLGGPGERVAKFCEFAEIKRIEELPAADFDKAVAEINRTNAAKAKKENSNA